jgi:type IV fimbrial biogenesis protein FimT
MKASSGFTLIELIVVITIVSILMAIGVPSFRYVTTSNRLSSEINGLLGDMQYARAQAMKEGQTVTVCSSSDGKTCLGTSVWTTGWIVFDDPGYNGAPVAGGWIWKVQPALKTGDTLQDNTGTLKTATFNRAGFSVGMPANGLTLTLHDSTKTKAWTRCLLIGAAGTLTTQTPVTAAGCQ